MDEYNYDAFRREHFKEELDFQGGPAPGDHAPDFELPTTRGETFRLGDWRGVRPVLFDFGSITCPMTLGATPVLKDLHREFSGRVEFVTVYVREAHPGEIYPSHATETQKMRHAADWAREERVPWTVAVDTIEGEVHRFYGPLQNSVYLVGRSGRVAFRALFAGQEGLLRSKIGELLRRESEGEDDVVLGEQKNLAIPLLRGAAEADRAIRRGGRRAEEDFRRALGDVAYGVEKLVGKARSAASRTP